MSTNSDKILNRIFAKLGMEEETVEVKLEQKKTEDGTAIIEADSFEAGVAAFVISEDEERIPLPMGEYTLEDGMVIKVDEMGVIVEVGEVKEEEEEVIEEVPAEMSEEPTAKKVIETKSEVRETMFSKEDFDKLNDTINMVMSKLEKLEEVNVKLSAENAELKEELKNTPATHEKFSPEARVENKVKFQIAPNKRESVLDRVLNQIA